MIKKSTELDFSNEKLAILIVSRPGTGKTTIAESAPKPLLLDLDKGVKRTEACYMVDSSMIDMSVPAQDRYDKLLEDIRSPYMSKYETIVTDTIGALFDLIAESKYIRGNTALVQRDGTLSQKGYGAVAKILEGFISEVKGLGKHLVFTAHAKEKEVNGVVKVRVDIPGSTKDDIWKIIDLGAYMEKQEKDIILHFTPTSKFDAKGVHGVTGDVLVPHLKTTKEGGKKEDNNILSTLINVVLDNMAKDQDSFNSEKADYDEAVKIIPAIDAITNVNELNNACETVKTMKHGLTSKAEIGQHVKDKAAELGAEYDKSIKRYVMPASAE